jgi:CHAT domain-containing protein
MAPRHLVIRIADGSITKVKTLAVVVGNYKGIPPRGAERAVDEALGGAITTFLNNRSLKSELGDFFAIPAMLGSLPAEVVVVMGLGPYDVFCRSATGQSGRPPLFDQVAYQLIEGLLASDLVQFATVLIGAGGGGLGISPVTTAFVGGICRALLILDKTKRINEFTIVEIDARKKKEDINKGLEDARAQFSGDLELEVQWVDLPGETRAAPSPPPVGQTAHISIRREAEKLTYSVLAARPLQLMKSQAINSDTLRELTEELLSYAEKGLGASGLEDEEKLKNTAATFYELLMPLEVREQVRECAKDGSIILSMEPTLVNVPWELCFDRGAEKFVCEWESSRQIMGDNVNREHPSDLFQATNLSILILANLSGNLPRAQEEGERLKKLFLNEINKDGQLPLQVELIGPGDFEKSKPKGPEVIKRLFSGHYDFIHYCGHAFFDRHSPNKSGWILDDRGEDVIRAFELSSLPRPPLMVFGNACQSAQSPDTLSVRAHEFAYGLAGAFISAGVDLYMGSIVKVGDESACDFALNFYRSLFGERNTIGTALRQARSKFLKTRSWDDPTWAGYVLYGSPNFRVWSDMRE